MLLFGQTKYWKQFQPLCMKMKILCYSRAEQQQQKCEVGMHWSHRSDHAVFFRLCVPNCVLRHIDDVQQAHTLSISIIMDVVLFAAARVCSACVSVEYDAVLPPPLPMTAHGACIRVRTAPLRNSPVLGGDADRPVKRGVMMHLCFFLRNAQGDRPNNNHDHHKRLSG